MYSSGRNEYSERELWRPANFAHLKENVEENGGAATFVIHPGYLLGQEQEPDPGYLDYLTGLNKALGCCAGKIIPVIFQDIFRRPVTRVLTCPFPHYVIPTMPQSPIPIFADLHNSPMEKAAGIAFNRLVSCFRELNLRNISINGEQLIWNAGEPTECAGWMARDLKLAGFDVSFGADLWPNQLPDINTNLAKLYNR
jgi:hypothetical protein